MSLSHSKVLDTLREKFVCGWENIKKTAGAGQSHEHKPSSRPADVNNGAGFRNLQIVVLTPDGRVVHCLPGYWKPEMLLHELEFALDLVRVWQDESLSIREKVEKFAEKHLAHLLQHSGNDMNRSALPDFDQWEEKQRTIKTDSTRSSGQVKKADQIVHERMAERPFVAMKEFDFAAFSDVGQKFYDAGYDNCVSGR